MRKEKGWPKLWHPPARAIIIFGQSPQVNIQEEARILFSRTEVVPILPTAESNPKAHRWKLKLFLFERFWPNGDQPCLLFPSLLLCWRFLGHAIWTNRFAFFGLHFILWLVLLFIYWSCILRLTWLVSRLNTFRYLEVGWLLIYVSAQVNGLLPNWHPWVWFGVRFECIRGGCADICKR